MDVSTLTIFLSIQFLSLEAARILAVFPVPSISHQIVYQPLTRELARRGHQVTVITPNPAYPKGQAPDNLIEIDVHDISYEAWIKGFTATKAAVNDNYFNQIIKMIEVFKDIIFAQVTSNQVRELLSREKGDIDLLIIENGSTVLFGYAHIFDVPVMQITSFGNTIGLQPTLDVVGYSSHPFFYPTALTQRIYNLTFFEKLTLIYTEYQLIRCCRETETHDFMKSIFGSDVPTASELNRNIHLHLRNNHRFWIDNQPSSLNVVYLGGIHIPPPKQLPQSLQYYLDSAKNGVIYMSLGTNIKTSLLPVEKIQIFFETFSKLPYKILLKWDTDTLPGLPENTRISKWFPQSDLLCHPNIKLFITQGGLQSTDEAIRAGVPLIGIPMIADQYYNTEKYVHHKIGKQLDLNTLTIEVLKEAIDTVIGDNRLVLENRGTSYRENIVRLRSHIEDQPTTALERAVWWTEHVLRRDGEHFYAGEANVSWTEYIELELILIVLSVVLCEIILLSYITVTSLG